MIELHDVSRWYGQVIAVNDVTLATEPGITALLGPNGAGKTTVMRIVMGLLRPSQGDVRVLGEDPWANPGLLRRIGYVPEGPPPWRHLSGRDCVRRGALLSHMDEEAADVATDRAIAEVGLDEAADRKVSTYSHGMAQRLKFALALVHEPEALVLDEPLLGTDPLSRRHLLEVIRRLAGQGRSVLLSTHVLTDVEALTDRIALMHHGRLMAHGTVQEIRDLLDSHPRTVRITTPQATELGRRLLEWPSVRSVEVDGDTLVVRTREAGPFYQELQQTILDERLDFEGITSPDDNVEAVFEYLTGGAAA